MGWITYQFLCPWPACFCFPGAGIKGVSLHGQFALEYCNQLHAGYFQGAERRLTVKIFAQDQSEQARSLKDLSPSYCCCGAFPDSRLSTLFKYSVTLNNLPLHLSTVPASSLELTAAEQSWAMSPPEKDAEGYGQGCRGSARSWGEQRHSAGREQDTACEKWGQRDSVQEGRKQTVLLPSQTLLVSLSCYQWGDKREGLSWTLRQERRWGGGQQQGLGEVSHLAHKEGLVSGYGKDKI